MRRIPRGVYTKEFREQAVRLVLEERLSIPQAGQRLSMSPKTLANWVGAARRGELAVLGGRQKPLTEGEEELRRLRRELAEVTMERDILKKALRTLPRRRCPVRADGDPKTPVSPDGLVPDVSSVTQRVLCLAAASTLNPKRPGRAIASGDSRRA